MGGYNKPLKKTERLHMLISPEEMSNIDDWRAKAGIASRSDAIRRLAALGILLDAVSEDLATNYAALWEAYSDGSNIALKLAKARDPDWKTCATFALKALSDLAEPHGRLSINIGLLTQVSAVLRKSPDLLEVAQATERIEAEAKAKMERLRAAYDELREGEAR